MQPPSPNSMVTLAELPPLAVAQTIDVRAETEDAARLKAMGICHGRKIQLVQTGDPLIVRVLGTRVGLSARLAELVLVKKLESPEVPAQDVGAA